MNTTGIKKIVAFALVVSTLANATFFAYPEQANAQTTVVDPGNIVESTITAVNTTASSIADYALQYKETVLDPIAYYLAKILLQQLTASIVDWINSGFDGSPAFLSDPGGFFLNIVDEEVGKFIAGSEDLKFLCSPFSIDLRLMLAFRYRPFKRKVTCTLSDVIKNAKNAGKNASINGFTAGDFKQGGWPAFVSMTTEPQNNIYGAYLEADSEISMRIGDKTVKQKDELNWGNGFLSWKKCTKGSVHTEGQDEGSGEGQTLSGTDGENGGADLGSDERSCETQTPGSVIQSQVNQALPSGMRSLELADEFNEIVNALFAQLVKTALTGGLKSVSNSSSGTDYLKQMEQEQAKNNAQVTDTKAKIITGIDTALLKIGNVTTERNTSLNQVILSKKQVQDVQICYQNKINATTGVTLSDSQKAAANQKIKDYDNWITTYLNPLADLDLRALAPLNNLSGKLNLLREQVTNASTVNDLSPLSTQYSNLYPSLPTELDVQSAIKDTAAINSKIDALKPSNVRQQGLQECEFFR